MSNECKNGNVNVNCVGKTYVSLNVDLNLNTKYAINYNVILSNILHIL